MITARNANRFLVCPSVYLASVAPVALGTLLVTGMVEDAISSYLYNFEGDFTLYGYLALASSLLVVAVPVYGLLSLVMYRSETASSSSFLDHLRHCVLLYAAIGATIIITILAYRREVAAGYTQPAPGAEVLVWIMGCARLINVLGLLWRQYSGSGESGGAL